MANRPTLDAVIGRGAAEPSPSTRAAAAGARSYPGHVPGEAGIWIFILGDMTLYAALFGSFMFDRRIDADAFNRSSALLHTGIGAFNTLLLLTSSLFVALGVRAVRDGIAPARGPVLFAGAFLCGAGFVVDKWAEYSELVQKGLLPTTDTFFTYYYVLTGIHLTHVLAGMCVLVYLWRVAKANLVQPRDITGFVRGVENGASFWHVVDLLWIVLFPLLYLVR
jgi:nitric oxide reductase NorE protein